VIASRVGWHYKELLEVADSTSGANVAAKVLDILGLATLAHIDAIGSGSSVVDHLGSYIGGRCIPVIGSEKPKRATDATGNLKFAKRRAELWWHMRDIMSPDTSVAVTHAAGHGVDYSADEAGRQQKQHLGKHGVCRTRLSGMRWLRDAETRAARHWRASTQVSAFFTIPRAFLTDGSRWEMKSSTYSLWQHSCWSMEMTGESQRINNHENKELRMLPPVIRRPCVSISLVPLLILPVCSYAVPVNWVGGTSDWFTGSNWDTGAPPAAVDLARINNGGTAQAAGSVTVDSLHAGNVDAALAATAGTVDINAGDLNLDGALIVGDTGGTTGSATGTVSVSGAINGTAGNLLVGNNDVASGTATGHVSADSYTGTHPGFIGIGRDTDTGSGTGSLVVTNALTLGSPVNFFEVGSAMLDGLNADGELRAASGDVVVSSFANIGAHFGSNTAAGNVRGVVDLGSGSLSNLNNSNLNIGELETGHSGTVVGELHAFGVSGFGSQDVGVTRGSAGSATGSLTADAGGISGGALAIGRSSGGSDASGMVTSVGTVTTSSLTVGVSSGSGSAEGSLDITAGDLNLSGGLRVGTTSGSAVAGSGSVAVSGAISGATGSLFIGSNDVAGGTATGHVSADSFTGALPGFIGIGRDTDTGSGTGSLVVTNALTLGAPTNFFEVGSTALDGLNADGELRAASGDVVVNQFANIGAHFGSNTAAGNVRGVVDLGSGSLSRSAFGNNLNLGELANGHSGTVHGELYTAGLSNFNSNDVGVAFGTSGSASGTLMVGSGGISGGSMRVGQSGNGSSATGRVTVNGGGVAMTGGISLGGVSGKDGTSADAEMSVAGGDVLLGGNLVMGSVSGAAGANRLARARFEQLGGNFAARAVNVGATSGAGSSDALMRLDGVSAQVERSLQIGESFDPAGNPLGRVVLNNSVLDVSEFVSVGAGLRGGAGDGGMTLVDSRLSVAIGNPAAGTGLTGDMFMASGGGASVAELVLRRSLVEVADRLFLGGGTRLQIDIEGGSRVSQYGAIDTDSAFLGGMLEVNFGFIPLANSMVFDLVVSASVNGIGGDFANVNILGLDPDYNATSGIVIDNIGGSGVEIYRLRIARAGVPEPASLLLMLLAFGVLLVVHRQRTGQAAA
jgi:hypothetical protein